MSLSEFPEVGKLTLHPVYLLRFECSLFIRTAPPVPCLCQLHGQNNRAKFLDLMEMFSDSPLCPRSCFDCKIRFMMKECDTALRCTANILVNNKYFLSSK